MIVISKKWKKLSYKILTALGIGMLTSCYGMPVTSNYSCVYGKVTGKDNKPIKGIKVSLDYNGITDTWFTDDEGCYSFEIIFGNDSDVSGSLIFEDVDGEENGSYNKKTEKIHLNEYGDCEKNVTLEEVKS